MILRDRPSSEQPQGTSAIGGEEPRILWASSIVGRTIGDALTQRRFLAPGTVTPTTEGLAATFNGSQQANQSLVLPSVDRLVVVARIRSTGTQPGNPGAAFGVYASTGTQSGVGVGFDTGGNVGIAYLNSNGAGLVARTTGAVGRWYTVAARLRSSDQAQFAWIDGRPATTGQGSTVTGAFAAPNEIAIGAQHRSAGFLRPFIGQVAWAAVLDYPQSNEVFTDCEALRLFEQGFPRSAVLPERRIWVPLAASGGGGVETGSSTLGAGYAVRSSGGASIAAGFAVRASGSATLDSGFAVRTSGSATIALGYAVRSAGLATLAAGYSVRSSGDSALAVGYAVDAASGVGSASLPVGYAVRAAGSSTLAAGFEIRAAGSSTLPTGYVVRSAGASTLPTAYAVTATGFEVLAAGFRVESSGGGAADPEEVWEGFALEAGLTPGAMLRIVMAAVAGRTEGIGTDTERYFSVDGTKPRITATFDVAGNRTTIVLDGTP